MNLPPSNVRELKTTTRYAPRIAAVIYDQETHSEADLAFLDAVARADREWIDQLNAANINFGGGSEAWQAVKNLATRQRDDRYAEALHALEMADEIEDEIEYSQQAAE